MQLKENADKLARRLKELEQETEDMPLDRSMWSVGFFIGLKEVGSVGSAYLAFLLFLTVFMQSSIIVLLASTTMTSPDFTETSVQQLRDWRRRVAQHITNYDPISGVTLTSRVCSRSDALSVSAAIEDDFKKVDQYLDRGNLVGTVMCVIALLSWYMTLGVEITSGAQQPASTHSNSHSAHR